MQNVLVTGATGFIGVELIRQLGNLGIRPRVLVRRPHRAGLLTSFEIDPIQGDLLNAETLKRAVDGVDTVFHLGGRASFESYRRLRPTIVEGTAELGRLSAAAGVEHFVYASSLFVYGDQQQPIDEDTPVGPRLGYGRAKVEAEERLARIADGSGMTLASLRLPHVYGAQSILFQQVRSGFAMFPGGMANRCGQLHVSDAARILAAAGSTRWEGASAVADSQIVTWTEYFDLLKTLYPYFRMISLPRWFGYGGAAALEPLLSRQGRPTLYTKDTVVGFNLDLPVTPDLVWSDVGLVPKYPTIYEGIPAVLDGYVQYRWRHPMMDRRRS
ncbi:MAG: NAD-dependent epimerase/dehydratase family protein [Acidimicrobiia bacterium]